jgi:hypothetical protein
VIEVRIVPDLAESLPKIVGPFLIDSLNAFFDIDSHRQARPESADAVR